MRTAWLWPALLVAAPAHADTPPKEDNSQTLSREDAERLAKLAYAHAVKNQKAWSDRYDERQENLRLLKAAIYALSPDFALVERLRQRERILRREVEQYNDENSESFMNSLSPDDRIKYLKMQYPGPTMLTVPD